jgi:hypothetical protein
LSKGQALVLREKLNDTDGPGNELDMGVLSENLFHNTPVQNPTGHMSAQLGGQPLFQLTEHLMKDTDVVVDFRYADQS